MHAWQHMLKQFMAGSREANKIMGLVLDIYLVRALQARTAIVTDYRPEKDLSWLKSDTV